MLNVTTTEQIRRLETLLADLLVRSEADAVYLCDRGGNIIAEHTAQHYSEEDNIIALAAGSFFATRELARLLGEPEFKCVFHQGARTSVFMQSTKTDLLVLVVFGVESNPGLVKLYSNEACLAIDTQIKASQDAPSTQPHTTFEMDPNQQLFKTKRPSTMGASNL